MEYHIFIGHNTTVEIIHKPYENQDVVTNVNNNSISSSELDEIPSEGSLKMHIDTVHEGKKPYKCSLCDNSFSQKSNLKMHIDSVHEGKKPYKCSLCGNSFSRKEHLKIHIDSVHEGKKPYKCSFCEKSFSHKGSLKRHIDSFHEGKKPYKCSGPKSSKEKFPPKNPIVFREFDTTAKSSTFKNCDIELETSEVQNNGKLVTVGKDIQMNMEDNMSEDKEEMFNSLQSLVDLANSDRESSSERVNLR